VHSVSQWLNLRHLVEPLGGAVGLLKAVSFKEAMESVLYQKFLHILPFYFSSNDYKLEFLKLKIFYTERFLATNAAVLPYGKSHKKC